MRIILTAAFLAALQSTLVAQSPAPEQRKRLIFQPGNPEPQIVATAPAAPAASDTPNTTPPDVVIDTFFKALKAGQVDAAYDGLTRGTVFASKPDNLKALKERTAAALDNYGPVYGYETVTSLNAGSALSRYTCVSFNNDFPLRWRFYFYKGPSGWKLVDLRVDDGLVEIFEEIARDGQPK